MKAMLLDHPAPIGSAPLLHREVDQPAPGDNQILIRVSVCGLCHTDLHTIEGELPAEKMPIIPGHQIVGYVEHRGARARRFNVGDRVGVAWLHRTCGECLHCSAGQENLCHAAQFTGYKNAGNIRLKIRIDQRYVNASPGCSENQRDCVDWTNRLARSMSDAVRWAYKIRLLPNHAKDLVRILLGACRHTICTTNTESMIDFRVQGWRLYQTLLGCGA